MPSAAEEAGRRRLRLRLQPLSRGPGTAAAAAARSCSTVTDSLRFLMPGRGRRQRRRRRRQRSGAALTRRAPCPALPGPAPGPAPPAGPPIPASGRASRPAPQPPPPIPASGLVSRPAPPPPPPIPASDAGPPAGAPERPRRHLYCGQGPGRHFAVGRGGAPPHRDAGSARCAEGAVLLRAAVRCVSVKKSRIWSGRAVRAGSSGSTLLGIEIRHGWFRDVGRVKAKLLIQSGVGIGTGRELSEGTEGLRSHTGKQVLI